MNRAKWLPAPRRSQAARKWAEAAVFLPLPAVSVLFLVMGITLKPIDEFGLAMLAVGLAGLVVSYKGVRYCQRMDELGMIPEDVGMLHELESFDVVMVSIWVLQGRAVTGRDRGAIWIEDGRLVFNGRATSFALDRSQVECRVRGRKVGPGELALLLTEETPAGPLALSFTPLIGDRPFATSLELRLAAWLDSPPSLVPGQVPPTALGPGAPSLGAMRTRNVQEALGVSTLVALVALPFAILRHVVPSLGLAWLALFLLVLALPITPAHRALHDRRRLEE